MMLFDEEAFLKAKDRNQRLVCCFAGGAALMLLNFMDRRTRDGDIIYYSSPELVEYMYKYNFNTNVITYSSEFPDGYLERIEKIDLKTKIIDFYVLSLEDLVVSKIYGGRIHDLADIRNERIVQAIDWDKLDELFKLALEGINSDSVIFFFKANYKDYIEECKK